MWGLTPYNNDDEINAYKTAQGITNPCAGTDGGGDDAIDIVIAGQFARVRIPLELREGAVLVPLRAVSELQGNFRVFVVAGGGTVSLRPVELGPTIGRLRIVNSGLKAGEKVAIEGLLTIRDGAVVVPKVVTFDEQVPAEDEAQG